LGKIEKEGIDMGIADRQYTHPTDCSCPQCKEAYERDEEDRQVESLLAAKKYRKDREFTESLRKMIGRGMRCKHSRPLSDGEKWEDTFCNLLGVTCHVVKGGFCSSEELISTEKEPDATSQEEKNITKSKENPNIAARKAYNKHWFSWLTRRSNRD
jgi:hypothetical protein